MFSLGVSEELEKVSCKHKLHDDVDWVIVHTHSQHLHNVLMVEVTTCGEGVVQDKMSSLINLCYNYAAAIVSIVIYMIHPHHTHPTKQHTHAHTVYTPHEGSL